MAKRRKKDVAEVLPQALEVGKCKTRCGRKSRTDGFCGICYPKYLKGHFLDDGRLHPKVVAKEKALAEKRAKRERNKKARDLKKDKELLGQVLDRNLLNILIEEHPEYRESRGCPLLHFWVSDAECVQRLFVLERKQCKKCTVHDDKVPFLKDFVAINAAKETT